MFFSYQAIKEDNEAKQKHMSDKELKAKIESQPTRYCHMINTVHVEQVTCYTCLCYCNVSQLRWLLTLLLLSGSMPNNIFIPVPFQLVQNLEKMVIRKKTKKRNLKNR